MTNSFGFIPSGAYFSKEVYSKELKTYRIVERGMIAYNPSRINVGSVALQDKVDEVVVSPLYVVFSVDEKQLVPEYVVRFLKSKPGLNQIADRSIGTVRNNLKYDALCRLEISCPSLETQRDRLETLNSIEKRINSQKAALSHLQTLVKSRFIEMFGDPEKNPFCWPMISIGELANDVRYGTSKPADPDGTYVYLRMNNITYEGSLDLSDIKRISLDGNELEKAKVVKGDLLFNRTNSRDRVGKTCVFNLNEPMVIAGYIIRVRLVKEVLPEYVSALLNSRYGKRLLKEMAHGAVNQANINAQEMKSIAIPVPPLDLQHKYLELVDRTAKLEFVAQRQVEKLQSLYDSLAQEYFG